MSISEIEARLIDVGIGADDASRMRLAGSFVTFRVSISFDRAERRRAARAHEMADEAGGPKTFPASAVPTLRSLPAARRDWAIDRLVSPTVSIALPAVCGLIRRSGAIIDGDRLCRDLAAMHGTPDARFVAALQRRLGVPEGRAFDIADYMRSRWARRLVRGTARQSRHTQEPDDDAFGDDDAG